MGNRDSGSIIMDNRFELPIEPFRAFIDPAASEPWRKTMLHQAERFWEGQSKLLEEYAAFTCAVIERRRMRAGAQPGTLRRMGSTTDGAEWAKCCNEWLVGSVSRIAEDSREILQESMKFFAEMSQNASAGMSEVTEASAEAQKAAMRQAVSAQSAAAEQANTLAQEAARAPKSAPPRPRRPEEGPRPGA